LSPYIQVDRPNGSLLDWLKRGWLLSGAAVKDEARLVRRVASLLAACVLNAIKHATRERKNPPRFAKIAIYAGARWIIVVNGARKRPIKEEDSKKDGTPAVIDVLSTLLSEQDDTIVSSRMGELPDIVIPPDICQHVIGATEYKHMFKTIVTAGDPHGRSQRR
jgi:hypothetical protein